MATTYAEVGSGISEHRDRRTTYAGVMVGSDGLCVLEVEEQRDDNRNVREYAEISLSLDGARKLRDLLSLAIVRIDAPID